MDARRQALLELHACVVLWGFTAVLGRLITLSATQLVWWRMLLVTLALACFPRAWRALRGMSLREVAVFAGVGCVIAIHWLCFYGSVKLANASVAATTMALAPVAVALSEPWLTGAKFERHNLLLAILVVPGVVLVVGGMPRDMHPGFWVGVASAVLAGVFNMLNKRHLRHHDAMAVTWVELGAGFLLLSAVMPFTAPPGEYPVLPSARDSAWLLVLAVFCTLIPFVLALRSLRHLSAFTSQLAVNLEPVYAILLAVIFLGEARELGPSFFIGVLIVLVGVFGHGFLQRRLTERGPSV